MLAEEHTLRKQREIEEQQKQNEEKKHEEEEKVNLEKLKYETLQKKRAQLLPEPLPSEEELLEVLFRLPNGTKISRRFRKTENIDVFNI